MRVESPCLEQFRMCASLHYASLFHHHYLVRMLYRGQTVGDDYGGTVLHQVGEGILHQSLAFGIQSRGGLVQNQNRRVPLAMAIRCR